MTQPLKKQSHVTVRLDDGETIEDASVTIFSGWVELSHSDAMQWYPRERVAAITKREPKNK